MIRVLTADELKDLAGDRVDAGFGSIETTQGCLPLTALDVDVQIEGLAAETTVRQQFRNVFDEPLEATYIFPLPPRAALSALKELQTLLLPDTWNAASPGFSAMPTPRISSRPSAMAGAKDLVPSCTRSGFASIASTRKPRCK